MRTSLRVGGRKEFIQGRAFCCPSAAVEGLSAWTRTWFPAVLGRTAKSLRVGKRGMSDPMCQGWMAQGRGARGKDSAAFEVVLGVRVLGLWSFVVMIYPTLVLGYTVSSVF